MVCGDKVLPGASLPVFNIFFRYLRGSKAKLRPTDAQVVGSSAGWGASNLTEAYYGEDFGCTTQGTQVVEINPPFSAGACQMPFIFLAHKTSKFECFDGRRAC